MLAALQPALGLLVLKRHALAGGFPVEHLAKSQSGGGDDVLVATGPLTNLALAAKLASGVGTLVIMGGGHEVFEPHCFSGAQQVARI